MDPPDSQATWVREQLVRAYQLGRDESISAPQEREARLRTELDQVLAVTSERACIQNIQARLRVQDDGLLRALLCSARPMEPTILPSAKFVRWCSCAKSPLGPTRLRAWKPVLLWVVCSKPSPNKTSPCWSAYNSICEKGSKSTTLSIGIRSPMTSLNSSFDKV